MAKPVPKKILDVQVKVAEKWIARGDWVRVESSNVHSIRYDLSRHTLHVRFKDKQNPGTAASRYEYLSVPVATARAMFNAPSMGKFVHYRLKGRYTHRGPFND